MRTHNVNNIQPIIATNIGKVSAGGWSVFVRKAGDSKRDTSNEALAAASPEAEAKAEFKAKVGFGIGAERSVASCVSHAGSVRRPRLLLLALLFAVTSLLALAPVMERGLVYGQTAEVPDGSGNPGDPYQIATWENLYWVSQNSAEWGKYFVQTADIDFDDATPAITTWDSNQGWSPIGNSATNFTGSYNGDGHTISNLYINRSNTSRIALFGETSGATIQNLGLINPDITVTGSGSGLGSNVGTLVGFAAGTTISQSFATGGSVTAEGSGVGGLVGRTQSNSEVSNSYAIVSVEGASGGFSAGLVGVNSSSDIINSYAAGNVVFHLGSSRGLTQNDGGTITNSFYDSQTTGQTTGSGTAKTTVEMQQQSTFIGWDFQCELSNGAADIWGIDEGVNYPVLSQFGYVQTCPDNVQVANSSGADGSYFSLAEAFIAIDAAGSQAGNSINIIIKTNQSIGTSLVVPTGDWSLIRIYPNTAGLSLSGTIDGPLVDFNGSDNIIIEGRVNALGTTKDLVIENLSTGSNASTLRFSNGAQNNTVQYAKIRGSSGGSASGVVHFAGSANGANSGNAIANNDITNAGGNRPVNAIYSSGDASPNHNVSNTLESNHIFDFTRSGGDSNGIHLADNTTDWVIDGNSLYETASITSASAGERAFIRIDNSANGNNFQILKNFIGGNSANAEGLFSFSGSSTILKPVFLGLSNSGVSLFKENTIRGLIQKNSYSSQSTFNSRLLDVSSGSLEIIDNTFGSILSGANIELTFNNSATRNRGAFEFNAISVSSTDPVQVLNNTIGGISVEYNSSISLRAISKTGAGNFTATNNTIGSSSGPIVANGDVAQTLTGILSQGTGLNTISGNTVSYLQRNTTTVGQQVDGINLSGNTSETAIIEKNFVHSLSSNSSSFLTGIRFTGQANILNNIVTLTSTSPGTVFGIGDFSRATRNIFYNTIFLDGADSAEPFSHSQAILSDSKIGNKTYQNNIVENRKSGNGSHYAFLFADGLDNITIDYNNYRVTGAGGFLGFINGVNYSDLPAWQTATDQDLNSLSIDPQFEVAGGTDPANYETSASLPGLPIAGITEDFFGNIRSATTPQMGAYEEPSCSISSIAPAEGDGLTSSTPYQIASFENLLWITEDPSRWDKFYVQTANIDAGATQSNVVCFGTEGWTPIGNSATKFTGSYNGDGHTISNLYINRSNTSKIALFGETNGATIENLGLIDPSITVENSVGRDIGTLVGYASNTTIRRSFASGGSVIAEGGSGENTGVGGLVGRMVNGSQVLDSYAVVAVNGGQGVNLFSAGLVGVIEGNSGASSLIVNSYAAGAVTDNIVNNFFGQPIPYSRGLTQNSTDNPSGAVQSSFYDEDTTGQDAGDFSGTPKTTVQMQQQATYPWDFQCETTNGTENIWVMENEGTDYPALSVFGFVQNCFAGGDGTPGSPYQIENWSQLHNVREFLSASFELTEHLTDASAGYATFASATANSNNGWNPIGTSAGPFTGTFDGNGFTISDLYIIRPAEDHVGLFGALGAGATVTGLTIDKTTITGRDNVGVLAGSAQAASITQVAITGSTALSARQTAGVIAGRLLGGVLTESYASDVTISGITGTNLTEAGGLVGLAGANAELRASYIQDITINAASGEGDIGGLVGRLTDVALVRDTYVLADITGPTDALSTRGTGGLIGRISSEDALVVNSYAATAMLTADKNLGGLIGLNAAPPASDTESTVPFPEMPFNVFDSFWDVELVGLGTPGSPDNSAGGLGLGTLLMKTQQSFTDSGLPHLITAWDFSESTGVWTILNDAGEVSYPYLRALVPDPIPGVQTIPFAGGAGTPSTPFIITNWTHLNNVRVHLSASFRLNADLNSSSDGYTTLVQNGVTLVDDEKGWAPIGTTANPFVGSFDGNEKSISGLEIARATENGVGLFGVIAQNAAIFDLTIEAAKVAGQDDTGVLVGRVDGGDDEELSLTNITISGQTELTGRTAVGTVVGWASRTTITNATIRGPTVGEPAVTYPTVTATTSGGLLGGELVSTGVIRSSATGSVLGNVTQGGGIAGYVHGLSIVSESWVRVTTIKGNEGAGDLGGLIGRLGGVSLVRNSYALADITGPINDTFSNPVRGTGGLIGRIDSESATVDRSYASSLVRNDGFTAYENLGGLVGINADVPAALPGSDRPPLPSRTNVTNSFWDVVQTGIGTRDETTASAGGTGKTNYDLKVPRTFTLPDAITGLSDAWSLVPDIEEGSESLWFTLTYIDEQARGDEQLFIAYPSLRNNLPETEDLRPGREEYVFAMADDDFPELGIGSAELPFRIKNWRHLHHVGDSPDGHYLLLNNLDDTDDSSTFFTGDETAISTYDKFAALTANGGAGFRPIGTSEKPFTGVFRSNLEGETLGYTISDFRINRSGEDHVGLFGYTRDATFERLRLEGRDRSISISADDIIGGAYSGGLIGRATGTLTVTLVELVHLGVEGDTYVGTLAGRAEEVALNRVSSQNSILLLNGANGYAGGLIGRIDGDATVQAAQVHNPRITLIGIHPTAGGVIGEARGVLAMERSFAISPLSSSDYRIANNLPTSLNPVDHAAIGGLIGRHIRGSTGSGTLSNSYSRLRLNTADRVTNAAIGGLIGEIASDLEVEKTYSASRLNAFENTVTIGGLIGINSVTEATNVSQSYWDVRGYRLPVSAGGEGLTTGELQNRANFTAKATLWTIREYSADLPDPGDIWEIRPGATFGQNVWYPTLVPDLVLEPALLQHTNVESFRFASGVGTSVNPFIIETWEQLNNIRTDLFLGSYYELDETLDKDLPEYSSVASGTANSEAGWEPIGTLNEPFRGVFRGNDKQINDLVIDRDDEDYVGLFGRVASFTDAFITRIENLGLTNVAIVGQDFTGGIAGSIDGVTGDRTQINQVFVTGTITGRNNLGGLSGATTHADYDNVYSVADVGSATSQKVGGLFGTVADVTVVRGYTAGKVTGAAGETGGLAASESGTNTVTHVFFDGNATGEATSAIGASKTPEQMRVLTTFNDDGTPDWSIATTDDTGGSSIWQITEELSYPYFRNNVQSTETLPGTFDLLGRTQLADASTRGGVQVRVIPIGTSATAGFKEFNTPPISDASGDFSVVLATNINYGLYARAMQAGDPVSGFFDYPTNITGGVETRQNITLAGRNVTITNAPTESACFIETFTVGSETSTEVFPYLNCNVQGSDIATELATENVRVVTAGDITLQNGIEGVAESTFPGDEWVISVPATRELAFLSGNDVNINSALRVSGSHPLNLRFETDTNINNSGNFFQRSGGEILTNNGNIQIETRTLTANAEMNAGTGAVLLEAIATELQEDANMITTSGNITFIADTITEDESARVSTTSGQMQLTPRTLTREIGIAGTSTTTLLVSETLLNTVLEPGAKPLFIGHDKGGDSFTATITVFASGINRVLHLKTTGSIQLGPLGSTSGVVIFNEDVSLETGSTNSAIGHIPVEMAAGKALTFLGGGVTFDQFENKVPRIVGNATTSEPFTFINSEELEVGTIGASYGRITIQTVTGDLNLTDAITSDSDVIDAIRLFADTQRLRGDFEGGQINASAGTILTTAAGGNILLYTGSIRTSTGIGPEESDVINIPPADYFFNKDATDAAGDLNLISFGDRQPIFAVLRETVATPPVITFARPSSTTMKVSFTAPFGGVGDGGSNVTGYEYQLGEVSSEDDEDWNTLNLGGEDPDLSAYFDKLVSSLKAGATLTIRLRALNLAGAGAPSDPVTRTLFTVGDGSSGIPFQVDNLQRLNSVRYHVGNPDIHFVQTENLAFNLGTEGDFAAPAGAFEGGAFYNNGAAWEPIGSDSIRVVSRPEVDPAVTVATRFSGVYDGGNHLITGLRINREDQNYTGLFGYVDGNNAGTGTNSAIIRNLALEDTEVSGGEHSGMLVGRLQDAEVSQVYTRGTIVAQRYVGGIAGSLAAVEIANTIIENSYSISEKISAGLTDAGGIAGLLDGNAILNKVYTSSIITTLVPGANRGALAGAQASSGNTINNAFWNRQYSEITAATGGGATIGGTGLNQASIRTLSTFNDTATPGLGEVWDIALLSDGTNTTSIWQIIEDVSFPFFRAFPEPPRPGAIILAGTVTNADDAPLVGNTLRIQPLQSRFTEIDPVTTIADGVFSTEVADYLDYILFSRQEVSGLHAGALIVHQVGLDPSGYILKLEPRTMTIVDGIAGDIGCRLENGTGGAPNELFAYVDCEVGANEIETEIERGSLILRGGADIDITRSVRPVFEPARTLLLEAGNDVILRANRAFEPDEQDNLAITIVADANNDENGSFIMEEGSTLYHGAAEMLVRANRIQTHPDATIESFERAVRFRPVGADRAIAITSDGTYSPELFASVLSPVTSQITVGGDGGSDAVSSEITLGDVTFGSPVRLITTGDISQVTSTVINTSGFSLSLLDANEVTLTGANVVDTLFADIALHLTYTSAGSFRAEDIETTSGVIRLSTLEDNLIVNRVVTSSNTQASGVGAAIVLSAHTSLVPNTLSGGNILRVDTSVVTTGAGGTIRYNTGTWAGSLNLQSIPLNDRLFNANVSSAFTSSSGSIVVYRERVPDQPDITFARPFADSLQVTFTLPEYTGTGDIQRVEFSLDGGVTWIERTDTPSDPARNRLSVFTSDTALDTGEDATIRLRLVTTATPGTPTGSVERTLFAGGNGTPGAPLQVASTKQLNSVRYQLDKHIVQDVDLAFTDEFDGGGIFNNSDRFWEPIGSVDDPFVGLYNGNEKNITGLRIGRSGSGTQYANPALFASVGSSGTIRALGIIDPDILGSVSTGALVSNLRGGTLEEVYVSGGSIRAISIDTGGLVGTMLGGLISRSYAHTNVTNTNTSSTTILVGGLVGNLMEGRISQSWSAGTVTANRDGVGGLIGFVNTTTSEGVETDIVIEDVYSVATVQARDGAGALFGALRADRGSLTVTNAYAAGNVNATGGSNVGGVLGRLDDLTTATILNTFWDANATGQSTSPIGTSKTPEEMRRLTTFTNTATSVGLTSPWSIALTANTSNTTSVWQLTQGFSYPYLRAVTPDPLPGVAVIAGTVTDGSGTVDGLEVRARPAAGFPELTPQTSAGGGAFTFTVADNINYDLFTRRLSGDLHEGGYSLYDGSTKTGLEVVLGIRSLTISSSPTDRSCIIESGEVFPYADCTVNSDEVREALESGNLVLRAGGTITQAGTADITAALPVPRTLTYDGRTGVSLDSGAELTATGQPLTVDFTSSGSGDAVVLTGAVTTNGGPVTVTANNGGVTYSGVLNTGGGSLISETDVVIFTEVADVNTVTGDIRLTTDALTSSEAAASLSTTGTLAIEPATSTRAINAGTGTGGLDLSTTFLQEVIDAGKLGLLVIGNNYLDAVITVGASFGSQLELRTLTTGAGSSGVVFTTSSFTDDVLVSIRGPVTQTGAITATGLFDIQGTGVSVLLDNDDNDFSVVRVGGTGSGDSDGKALYIVLTAANAFTLDGLFSTGEIDVATRTGDLTIHGDIVTDDTGISALILVAGRDTNAGTSTGGNLVFTQGTPVVTVGDDGRALFYAGSLNGSTGLSVLVDDVNNRYFEVDAITDLTTLSPPLPATGFFALLRETTASAPIIVAVLPFADKLEIRFILPTDDGGSAIQAYQILLNGGTWDPRTDGGTNKSPILVSGLTPGNDVTVQIRAINTAGGGAASNAITRTLFAGGEGALENPLQVATVKQLNSVRFQADKHFVQTGHLAFDLGAEGDFAAPAGSFAGGAFYNDGTLWQPIGTGPLDTGNPAVVFTGTYNGGNHRIEGLRIARGDYDEFGLFGHINGTQARVKHLGLTALDITGRDHVGGIAGKLTSGELRDVFVHGSVTGRHHTGGLAGSLGTTASIEYAYSVAGVAAETHVGGLVGSISGTASVNETYAAGAVVLSVGSSTDIGGLIGSASGTPTVTNSFFDLNNTGQIASAGGTASTPAAMRTLLTYSDVVTTGLDTPWEIALANGPSPERWKLNEGLSYPYFAANTPPELPGTAQLEGVITLNGAALGGAGETTLRARPVAAFPERSVETVGGKYKLLVANNLDYDLFARVAEGELFATHLVRFEGETNRIGSSFTGNDLNLAVRSVTIAAGATDPACILEDGLLIPYANCSVNANEVRDALLAGNLDVRAQDITVDSGISAALPAARTLQLIAGDAITLAVDQSIATTGESLNLLVRTNATNTDDNAFGTLTLAAGSAVDVLSGNLTLAVDNLTLPESGTKPQINGTAALTLRSARDSRVIQLGGTLGDQTALRFTSELLEEVLGGAFTTLTVGHTTHDAAVDLAGAELRSNLRLISGGTLTQSDALTAALGRSLILTLEGSGSMTLDDSANSFTSLSISGSGTGSQHYVNAGVLSLTGVISGGPVTVATLNGNLDLQGDITTTDDSDQAIRLVAGRDRVVGDGEGGNVRMVGSSTPAVTAGAGARILIYSAVLTQSTGLFERAGSDMDRVFRNIAFDAIPGGADGKTGIVLLLRETVPGAPVIVSAAPFSDRVVLSFTPPVASGGTDIRNYEFTIDDGTYVAFAPIRLTSPATIGGLSPGETLQLRLRAVNEAGAGEESALIVRSLFNSGEGTEADPFQVASVQQLNSVRFQADKQFLQTADLAFGSGDFAAEDGETPEGFFYNDGAFWQPIGSGTLDTGADAVAFSGVYNGDHYNIDGLRINRGSETNIGLFGHVNGAEAAISQLGLVDVDITGGERTGALTGLLTEGLLEQVFITGSVTGTNTVGGIAGRMETDASAINSYSIATVTGVAQVGGFAGALNGSSLEKVYAAGPVGLSTEGSTAIGGLIGSTDGIPTVANSFWDTVTTGQATSAGDLGTGNATADMTRLSTFENLATDGLDELWSIALYNASGSSIWQIVDQNSYPYFRNNTPDPLPGFNENARFARVTGNWDNPSTWTVFGCSTEPGSEAPSSPSTMALVSICGDHVVSLAPSKPVIHSGPLEIRQHGQLRVRNASILTLDDEATLTVRMGGTLAVDQGAGLDLTADASLITEAGGTSVIRSGGQARTLGSVTGDLRFERMLPGAGTWVALSSPVAGSRYGSPSGTDTGALLARMFTRGFPGSDSPAAPASITNVLEYNEAAGGNRNQRFIVPSDNSISPGSGFFVFTSTTKLVDGEVEPVDYTLPFSVTGIENTPDGSGNFVFGLSYSNAAPGNAEDGWNLLGNPFGSALNWAAADGWTRPEQLNGFIYIYDAEAQRYRVSDNTEADGSEELSFLSPPIIAPFQAFWVKTNNVLAPGTNLLARPAARVLDFVSSGFFRALPAGADEADAMDGVVVRGSNANVDQGSTAANGTEPLASADQQSATAGKPAPRDMAPRAAVILSVQNAAGYAASMIRFGEGYSTAFTSRDAYYLTPRNNRFAYVYTVKEANAALINSLPVDLNEVLTLPLAVGGFHNGLAINGESTLFWDLGPGLPANVRLRLIDRYEGVELDITEQGSYTFTGATTALKTQEPLEADALRVPGTPVMQASLAGERFVLVVDPLTATSIPEADLPGDIELSQNFPNPFNPTSTIRYALPEATSVRIEVFNITGQRVALLVEEARQPAGRYTVVFDGSRLASGVYIYRMVAGDVIETRKMILLK